MMIKNEDFRDGGRGFLFGIQKRTEFSRGGGEGACFSQGEGTFTLEHECDMKICLTRG